MHIDLVFDTETTGKTDFSKPPHHDSHADLVQLCAKLVKGDEVLGKINFITVPKKAVEPGAEATHGITSDRIATFGVPRRIALAAFNHLLKPATRIVAHNLSFDILIIRAAYYREGADSSLLDQKAHFCTMKTATPICKIPGPRGNKWPTLQEAYKHLVDPAGFSGAHNAEIDVEACDKVKGKLDVILNNG